MPGATRWWLASGLVALLLGAVLLLDFSAVRAPPAPFSGVVFTLKPPSAGCQPVVGANAPSGCVLSEGERRLELRMLGDVRPLRPFELRVRLPEAVRKDVTSVSVDFVMVGMDMGINRYSLPKRADGDFVAQVILPVCSVGRSDWVARIDVLMDTGGAKEKWTAEVPFTAEPSVGAHE